MPELDEETKAWLAKRALEEEAKRVALFAAMKAAAEAPGVSRPGPGEAPLENWQEMYGPDGPPPAPRPPSPPA